METNIIKEFKAESYIEIIQKMMANNNGYITTKELETFDIHRMYLQIMKKRNLIEKVAPGIYIDATKIEDKYYIFGLSMPNAIFSHMTVLYFHGLSIKAPNERYDITVKRTYNNAKLRDHEVFYVTNDLFELGLTEIKTPSGNKVKCYDIERCICDIIRSKKRMDSEYVKYSIRECLKSKDKNLAKLSEYATKMGIKKEVMEYISIIYG